jgi:O-antigen/teichoic acid export membrane protein
MTQAPTATATSEEPYEGRFTQDAVEAGLRTRTARGTIVNAAFQIGLAGLMFLRRIIVAAFLTASEFGVWGVLLGALLTILFIKDIGIGDRYVQQAEADQERAFQKLFTIDLLLGTLAVVLSAVALPLFALAYGKSEIILPGIVLSLAIIGNCLQSPTWIYYRQMDFVRQRALLSVDPIVGFVVTVGLAIAGAGYWSLIVGGLVGAFSGAAAALATCPYKIRFRLDKGTIGDYFSFSWPLALANGSGLAVLQGSLLIATRTLGLAGAGAIGLAGSIAAFADGVDGIVTQTLYPAICAVRDRTELMFEAFVKSNRLALMWGMPFGIGVALFAPDLVHFVIGARWQPAIIVIQSFGLVGAIDQLGFNWSAFFRALNQTRPLAAVAVLNLVAFVVITAPLMIAFGLKGFALGWLLGNLVMLTGRTYYLTRLFAGFSFLGHAARAIAPMVPATGGVLLLRLVLTGDDRTLAIAIGELALFIVITAAATAWFERHLIREILGYLRTKTSTTQATQPAVE